MQFRLTGEGIDRKKLIKGEDIEFGVEVDVEADFEEESQKYFDRETIFKTLNFDCCDDGEDSGNNDKVSCMIKEMTLIVKELSEKA